MKKTWSACGALMGLVGALITPFCAQAQLTSPAVIRSEMSPDDIITLMAEVDVPLALQSGTGESKRVKFKGTYKTSTGVSIPFNLHLFACEQPQRRCSAMEIYVSISGDRASLAFINSFNLHVTLGKTFLLPNGVSIVSFAQHIVGGVTREHIAETPFLFASMFNNYMKLRRDFEISSKSVMATPPASAAIFDGIVIAAPPSFSKGQLALRSASRTRHGQNQEIIPAHYMNAAQNEQHFEYFGP